MKKLFRNLRIKLLQKEGYESYTITINGKITTQVFYSPERIYKYDKEKFNY